MGSMILATNPGRRILQASQELAESVGCPSKLMAGLDCASIVRCRNSDGKPLCQNFCPALRAARAKPGTVLEVPNVRHAVTADRPDIARVVVSIAGNTVNAFDANGNLIFHAPTTVGSKYDPSPNETLKVTAIVHDPPFHYDPTLYSEVPDTDPDAHLQPGPNSPVGVVWMQLSKEHYGIHGTEDPSSIGYVSSHGCIRLCNWDAEEISHRISKGTPVVFVDTKR